MLPLTSPWQDARDTRDAPLLWRGRSRQRSEALPRAPASRGWVQAWLRFAAGCGRSSPEGAPLLPRTRASWPQASEVQDGFRHFPMRGQPPTNQRWGGVCSPEAELGASC